MKNLLYKELKLCVHPTSLLFLGLSALLIIPNYPYLVTFFYTGLAVFFICLTGRENHDIFYTVSLPVQKQDIVKARFYFVILLELLQILLAIPFAILRQHFNLPGNQVGMDANIALFGFAFVMLGIFNLLFFENYYKAPDKVGSAFAKACIAISVFILIIETCTHAVPFVRDYIDTTDPLFIAYKLPILGVGLTIYIILTVIAYRKSIQSFEKLDL